MNIYSTFFILLSLIVQIFSLPHHNSNHRHLDDENPSTTNIIKNSTDNKFSYASIQSQIIITNLLKDSIDIDANNVFSPLGVSSILAILAEGSRGDTYKEFQNSLGYPVDKNELRQSFKEILKNFASSHVLTDDDKRPSFKTWFYIYKNNTVREEFKEILRKCYSVEVKDIDEIDFNWNEPDTAPIEGDKDDDFKTTVAVNSKDIVEFEDLKKSELVDSLKSEPTDDNMFTKEASKFDAVVDDKQYVEVPVIKLEIAKANEEKKKLNKESMMSASNDIETEKEKIVDEEKITEEQNNILDRIEKLEEKKVDEKKSKEEVTKPAEVKENLAENDIDRTLINNLNKKQFVKEKETTQIEVEKNLNNILLQTPDLIDKNIPNEMIDKKVEAKIIPIEENLGPSSLEIRQLPKLKEELEEVPTLVEEAILKEGLLKFSEKRENQLSDPENFEDNETVRDDEKIEALRKDIHNTAVNDNGEIRFDESEEPEKITVPLKKFNDKDEIMEAMESHLKKTKIPEARSLFRKDDIASALSANSITGRSKPSKTKILLFNGLYYRGNWQYPFQELRSTYGNDQFYVSRDKTIKVKLMKTRGNFRFTTLDSLDSKVVELPYENDRYAFLVILPNDREGLHNLIDKLQPVDLQMIQSRLNKPKLACVSLPKFEAEETSRSESTLMKLGLKKIFSAYTSDLGDLSEDKNLHVEEIVQHVNIKVDEKASSKNAISASNPSRSVIQDEESEQEEEISVNHPFLYFVLDRIENFIVVGGKISLPETKQEIGVSDSFKE